jgi:predicted DNA-binding transcriptional regulator AlpA
MQVPPFPGDALMAHVVMIEPNSNDGSLLIPEKDSLLSVEDVAGRLNVSRDWVWDHSSRKSPYLPVIRMSDGVLRYRASQIEAFINERERLSSFGRKRR